MATRREREKEETQRRILEAARELFVAEGVHAVTMRKIAERIEYTPTALYFHFQDKEALLRRLCSDDYAALAARFQVLSRVPDPLERLRMLLRAYVTFTVEHAPHVRYLFGAAGPGEPPPRQAYEAILPCVTEAMEAGLLRRGPGFARLAAQTLWAGAHGVATLAMDERPDDSVEWSPLERRVDAMVESLLRGMAPLPPTRVSGRRSG